MNDKKNAFLICPVRMATPEINKQIKEKIDELSISYNIYWPYRDTKQNDDLGGIRICSDNLKALRYADVVFIWWDPESKGSHFDLGMAFALNKDVIRIDASLATMPGHGEKSFIHVIAQMEKREFVWQ